MALTFVALFGAMGSLLMHMSQLGQESALAYGDYSEKGVPEGFSAERAVVQGSENFDNYTNYSPAYATGAGGAESGTESRAGGTSFDVYLYATIAFMVLGLIAAIQLAVRKGNELIIPKKGKG